MYIHDILMLHEKAFHISKKLLQLGTDLRIPASSSSSLASCKWWIEQLPTTTTEV